MITMPNYVAWTMRDGHTMAGEVLGRWPISETYHVRRVDGGLCNVSCADCRPATTDDVELACEFYSTPGSMWKSLTDRKREANR